MKSKSNLVFIVLFSLSLVFYHCSEERSNSEIMDNLSEEKIILEEFTEADKDLTSLEKVLEKIIRVKLQEYYDLTRIVGDSTLPEDMRLKAENARFRLLVDSLPYTIYVPSKVSDLVILSMDSVTNTCTVSYSLLDSTKEAIINIQTSTVEMEGKQVKQIGVLIDTIH